MGEATSRRREKHCPTEPSNDIIPFMITEINSPGLIHPSAAYAVPIDVLRMFDPDNKKQPAAGDVVFGEYIDVGSMGLVEDINGRFHKIHPGRVGFFVFTNRYAPDNLESVIPSELPAEISQVTISGTVGVIQNAHDTLKRPATVKILGYVVDSNGAVVNTKQYSRILPADDADGDNRAKLIIVCGSSMNSGKSYAATTIARALSQNGASVSASKVTGTASLRDILRVNDAGANDFADFTFLGHPSTYLLDQNEVLEIFTKLENAYAGPTHDYWIVEIADGINQRETSMLLRSEFVKKRMHKLVFCAADALGTIGGIRILQEEFQLAPDAISGVVTASPLLLSEVAKYYETPVIFSGKTANLDSIRTILE